MLKILEQRRLEDEALKLKKLEEEKAERERFEKHVTSVLVKFVENTEKAVDEQLRLPLEVATEVHARLKQTGWPVELKRVRKVSSWHERAEGAIDLYAIVFSGNSGK